MIITSLSAGSSLDATSMNAYGELNHRFALVMGAMNELWADGDVDRAQHFIDRACALIPENPTHEMCRAMIDAS